MVRHPFEVMPGQPLVLPIIGQHNAGPCNAGHSITIAYHYVSFVKAHASRRYLLHFTAVLFLFTTICFALTVQARTPFKIDAKILDNAEKKFGQSARERLLAWQELIQNGTNGTDLEKLDKVNTFFNTIIFVPDEEHWQQEDYWATPVELLASNGGDCEDFSLAKYFTLRKMAVPDHKLNLTYVTSLTLKQAHMVLTYYETPEAEPLVLDNLIPEIKVASARADLLPVYSFNGTGLWLAKARGKGRLVGDSSRLKHWRNLLKRMPAEFIEANL